jgi:WD40 repeat protein
MKPLQISLVHQFEQQRNETWDVHFSLDGSRLISSDGNALYFWQLSENGSWSYEQSLSFHNATFPRFAPDGKTLAFGGKEAFIKLISFEGREIATFPSPSHADWAFSPDGRWLVSSDTKRDILLWNLTTYQSSPISIPFPAFDLQRTEMDLSDEQVGRFRFTPDSQRLVFGASSSEGYVHMCYFDPVHKRIVRQKTLPIGGILTSAIAPDGKMLAILDVKRGFGPSQTEVFIYDLESLQLFYKLPSTTEGSYSLLTFSPDSHFLATSKTNGIVDIWSTSPFEYFASFAAHPGLSSYISDPIGGLDWSRTGYIATGGASVFEKDMKKTDFTIKLWKVEDEERQ